MAKTRAGRTEESNNSAAITTGKTYFLGIGIDQYKVWPRLRNAVRDVQVISKLLIDDYELQPENSYVLYNGQATREAIIHALEDMADRVSNTDSLIVYYAGHGHLNDRKRGYWVPADAPKNGISYYISNSTIRDYLKDINSLHTLLISDSCFSGSLFVRGQRSGDLAAKELAKLSSRWAICSGRHDEVVADGPKDGHSPFAESIVDVLQKTESSVITTNFLLEQVRQQTRANYDQLPDGGPIQGVGHKRGQYVFQRRRNEATIWAMVQEEKSLKSYYYYLNLYPKGVYVKDANERIHDLRGDEEWQSIVNTLAKNQADKQQILDQIDRFCENYPRSKHFREAEELRQNLESSLEENLEEITIKDEVQPDPRKWREWLKNSRIRTGLVILLVVTVIFWILSQSGNKNTSPLDKALSLQEQIYSAQKEKNASEVYKLRNSYRTLPSNVINQNFLQRVNNWVDEHYKPPPPPPPPRDSTWLTEIFTIVEKMPVLVGCDNKSSKSEREMCSEAALKKYLSENLKYPRIAEVNGVEGTVKVSFIIERDGSISNPQILKDPGAGCGEAAVEVLNGLKWVPGKQRGREVRVKKEISVPFKL